MKQKGQVIIILLLIILVSLSIGLAVVQNSLTDISTSTKTDQASRAFSAAEAGLESALLTGSTIPSFTLGNAGADVKVSTSIPDPNSPGQGLEYPPITKADFAHFWLLDPLNLSTLLQTLSGTYTANTFDYNQGQFDLYFGKCTQTPCEAYTDIDTPAVEVNVVTYNIAVSPPKISNNRFFFDPKSRPNGFTVISSNCLSTGVTATTNGSTTPNNSRFYCKVTVTYPFTSGSIIPVLARVRILYTNTAQKVAVVPTLSTNKLPPQASVYSATGISGDSTRKITVFREKKVVPYFFDYAIFSKMEVNKIDQ